MVCEAVEGARTEHAVGAEHGAGRGTVRALGVAAGEAADNKTLVH